MKTKVLGALALVALSVACGEAPDGASGKGNESLNSQAAGQPPGRDLDPAPIGAAGQAGAAIGGAAGSAAVIGGAAGEGGAGGAGAASGGAGAGACEPGCETEFLRSSCGDDGKIKVEACPPTKPFCSMGDCVQCRGASECVEPEGTCYEAACVAGVCSKKPRAEGEPCAFGGVCLGGGVCGVCLPGARECLDGFNAPLLCSSEGQWGPGPVEVCGGDLPACSDGGCGGVEQMALGGAHSCALIAGGAVYCWGSNEFGQAGSGEAGGALPKPRRVAGLPKATQIAAGYDHTCALVEGGEVWCWGRNAQFQLGVGAKTQATKPIRLEGKVYKQIAAGGNHTCAINGQGRVECWGSNAFHESGGADGIDAPVPFEMQGLEGTTLLSLGKEHSCALRKGKVYCWGGMLDSGLPSSTPVEAAGPSGIEAISAGTDLQLAAFPAGNGVFSFWAWGDANSGQFYLTPELLNEPELKIYEGSPAPVLVQAGYYALGMLLDDGALAFWGSNGDGRLGGVPGQMAAVKWQLPKVGGFAMGDGHTCAWQTGGRAWCWGSNLRGQVGANSDKARLEAPFELAW